MTQKFSISNDVRNN